MQTVTPWGQRGGHLVFQSRFSDCADGSVDDCRSESRCSNDYADFSEPVIGLGATVFFLSHSKLLIGGVLSASIVVVGCKGVGSNLVHRNQSNSAWEHKKLKGIPITVEVPTHVRVSVIARHSFYGAELTPVAHCGSAVKYDFIRTKKIFTVDPKRPAAGTAKWNIDLEGQYVKKAESEISDLTIQQTSVAIENVIKSGGFGALFRPAGEETQGSQKKMVDGMVVDPTEEQQYRHIDSVTATRIFDIEDPSLEDQVAEFLRCHLNEAHVSPALHSSYGPLHTPLPSDVWSEGAHSNEALYSPLATPEHDLSVLEIPPEDPARR